MTTFDPQDETALAHDDIEPDPEAAAAGRQWTVEQVLAEAELPERTATICVKASLEDRFYRVRAELSTLVDADGRPLDDGDDEASLGDHTGADRVQALADEEKAIRAQMKAASWSVLFRGKSTDDMALFNKQHYPKPDRDNKVDLTSYNNRLIAECAIDPSLTITQVIALRGKLGSRAFSQLAATAQAVCVDGGVDIPKSLT